MPLTKPINLEIKGFIETSLIDWDGHVVSVVYLPYCNYRCPFCHNTGIVSNSDTYPTVPIGKVMDFLGEHLDFLDGVCITGGEPTLHNDKGLVEFIEKVRHLGLKIKFDTNGSDPRTLTHLINKKLLDYIAMDIKAPLDLRYAKLSGSQVDLDKVSQSIAIIMGSGIDHEFRTTVVADMLVKADIEEIARYLTGAKKLVLQQFEPRYADADELKNVKPYSREAMLEMQEIAKKYVPNTILRGI